LTNVPSPPLVRAQSAGTPSPTRCRFAVRCFGSRGARIVIWSLHRTAADFPLPLPDGGLPSPPYQPPHSFNSDLLAPGCARDAPTTGAALAAHSCARADALASTSTCLLNYQPCAYAHYPHPHYRFSRHLLTLPQGLDTFHGGVFIQDNLNSPLWTWTLASTTCAGPLLQHTATPTYQFKQQEKRLHSLHRELHSQLPLPSCTCTGADSYAFVLAAAFGGGRASSAHRTCGTLQASPGTVAGRDAYLPNYDTVNQTV